MRELAAEVVADLPVLKEAVGVLLAVGEPPRLPVGGDAEPKPVRVDLLAHQSSSFGRPGRFAGALRGVVFLAEAPVAFFVVAFFVVAFFVAAFFVAAFLVVLAVAGSG